MPSLDAFADRLAARGFGERRQDYRVDAHYAAQVWDIGVDLRTARLASGDDVAALVEDFHAGHRRIFSVDDPASPIEFLNWTGRVSVALPPVRQSAEERGARTTQPIGRRCALFDVDDAREVPVYRGDQVRAGDCIAGPAVIEEATTTIVLPPGTTARVTPAGSYLIALGD